jgi:hypothetical protein
MREMPHRPHRPRQPRRLEIAEPGSGYLLDFVVSDEHLQRMTYRKMRKWCAGADGRLLRSRLERVARLRDYDPRWVSHMTGRHWREALATVNAWRRRQLAGD